MKYTCPDNMLNKMKMQAFSLLPKYTGLPFIQ